MTIAECPFCHPASIMLENRQAYVIRDSHPVNPGHLLIISRRHVADFFDTTQEEKLALLVLLEQSKAILAAQYAPEGFNIGINVGEAAGQTISHVHMHLYPALLGRHTQSARRRSRRDSGKTKLLTRRRTWKVVY